MLRKLEALFFFLKKPNLFFIKKHNFSKLKWKEIENMNRLITSMETETIIKKTSNKKKAKSQMSSQINSIKYLAKN